MRYRLLKMLIRHPFIFIAMVILAISIPLLYIFFPQKAIFWMILSFSACTLGCFGVFFFCVSIDDSGFYQMMNTPKWGKRYAKNEKVLDDICLNLSKVWKDKINMDQFGNEYLLKKCVAIEESSILQRRWDITDRWIDYFSQDKRMTIDPKCYSMMREFDQIMKNMDKLDRQRTYATSKLFEQNVMTVLSDYEYFLERLEEMLNQNVSKYLHSIYAKEEIAEDGIVKRARKLLAKYGFYDVAGKLEKVQTEKVPIKIQLILENIVYYLQKYDEGNHAYQKKLEELILACNTYFDKALGGDQDYLSDFAGMQAIGRYAANTVN